MKKVLISAVGLAALAGAYVAYPYYSVNRLGDAVSSSDPEKLQVLVDWSSVRNGLETDLNALLTGAVSQTAGDSPGRALGQIVLEVLGPKVIENAVDTYSTPEGFAELIRSGGAIDMKAAASRTIAKLNAAAAPADVAAEAPSVPLSVAADPVPSAPEKGVDIADTATQAAFLPVAEIQDNETQAEAFSVKVKAVRFVGVNAMEIEFETPDNMEKSPVKGIMKLSGATWKITRLILPIDEMLDAPLIAEMPQ
jgi:hypothetical protein